MRIIFMGTPTFAIPSLKALLEARHSLPAVVTVPDRPQGRGRQVGMSAVKEFALSHSIPVLQPEHLGDPGFIERMKELRPDLFVVVAFRILPKEVFTIPSGGAFNLHASLLPKYRGAAPINWAIMNGESETGVTTFFLQEKVDTGSILLQKRTAIGPDETAGELTERLAGLGAQAVLETVQSIAEGSARPFGQNDSAASLAPKIHKEDCLIPWQEPSIEVHNFIRGLSPVPCAWTTFRGKNVKVYRSSVPDGLGSGAAPKRRPGEIVFTDTGHLHVQTGDGGVVSLLEIQQEGRKRMGIAEFLRGFPIQAGEAFGN